MRVIALPPLTAFWTKHPDAEEPLRSWVARVHNAKWQTPNEIRADFATVSILGNNRVVFNIKGNDYRLIVAILYRPQIVLIKFIGTHAEYDKIDATTVEIETRN